MTPQKAFKQTVHTSILVDEFEKKNVFKANESIAYELIIIE